MNKSKIKNKFSRPKPLTSTRTHDLIKNLGGGVAQKSTIPILIATDSYYSHIVKIYWYIYIDCNLYYIPFTCARQYQIVKVMRF